MQEEAKIEIVENELTSPVARRVIMTYKVKVNAGEYSSLDAETMVIIDLPPNTTPQQAIEYARTTWHSAHDAYGEEFSSILIQQRDNIDKVERLHPSLQKLAIVIKTMWGNLRLRKDEVQS